MEFYSYYRSSAAYRVRIALNVKGLDYQYTGVNLLRGEELSKDYLARNPQGLVPALRLRHGDHLLSQSMAICEYLEEICPAPPLLPGEPVERANVRALAQLVACEIHPLNNLRVLEYLVTDMGLSEERKLDWYRHWVAEGLDMFERTLAVAGRCGAFCHGDKTTLADVFLVPQVYNGRRFTVDLTPYPRITAIEANCLSLEAFDRARPELQPDAVDT